MANTTANKVKFGLKNVHYATITTDSTGKITYGKPVAWPGAVNLSLDAEGDTNSFYADDIAYYVTVSNNGYSGDFESALIPESFKLDVMGWNKNTNGVIVETADAVPKEFALLFEFTGDASMVRHVLYNCKATRPSISGKTKEDSVDVQTDTLSLKATPRTSDHVTMAYVSDTSSSVYARWYDAVVEPTETRA